MILGGICCSWKIKTVYQIMCVLFVKTSSGTTQQCCKQPWTYHFKSKLDIVSKIRTIFAHQILAYKRYKASD